MQQPSGRGFKAAGVSILIAAGAATLTAQQGQGANAIGTATPRDPRLAPLVLHLSEPVDPAGVTVMTYEINGRDEWQLVYGPPHPFVAVRGRQDIAVDINLNGQPAVSVKAVLYATGFRFAFVDVPSLPDLSSRIVAVPLSRIGQIPLRGHVTVPPGEIADRCTVEVQYDASRLVLDYLLKGTHSVGPVTTRPTTIARAVLSADGTFEAMVPDLLKDPSVAAAPGGMQFVINGAGTTYKLRPDGEAETRLPLASAYASRVELVVTR